LSAADRNESEKGREQRVREQHGERRGRHEALATALRTDGRR
jgi:hypothetical protein